MVALPGTRQTVAARERRDFSVSDASLLALVSGGDCDALGAIYDRHIEVVWKLAALYAASVAAAEQAVSEVFQRLWRNPQPSDHSSLRVRLLLSVRRTLGDPHETYEGREREQQL